ncbi:hypothetical protein P872_21810 [Rhodonellum psychrophilum GCM71 = DSM 17998]|uniref:FAS1 domain-containing protein n=2 Tax=Rhodonellum TaxID=336827 RepID=U5BSF9_9BACT|nr:hypothetical protein P872_21810 [Rhodonellum psychrophilum GCM71 = DSM 17998]
MYQKQTKTNKQMKNLRILSLAAAVIASSFAVSCNNAPKEEATEEIVVVEEVAPVEAPNTVVDIAMGSTDHTTLVTAVAAAGLVETLNGTGPFTVFAPTNAAFNALPAGTVETLLKPESKEKLTGILTYHVVAGNVMAADLSDGQVVTTLNGQELKVSIKDGKVMINGANVTAADLAGTNGVVHVIDAVLMPK